MKQLILVGNQKVKFQDTETTISLTLVSDGNTVTIDSTKTYSVKIKNGTGYVKAINATPDTTNNMVTFSTSGFDGLPVDAYFLELWVIDANGQTIYPSDSFIELDITANATGVQGQVVPAITMQEFEERFSTLQSDLETKVGTLIGPTGNGINTVVTEYQLSASGINLPTGTWSKSPVPQTDDLPYLWARTTTTYTDKSTHVSYNISAKGTKGNNFTIQGSTNSTSGLPSKGIDGEGYMVGTELYVWTNGKWNDIVNMKGDKGDQGIQGIQGIKGDTGNGISSTTTDYQLSASGSNVPTGTWSKSPATPTDTLPYMWTRNVTTYTDKSTHVSYNISAKGTKGNNFTIQGSTSSIAGLPSTGVDGEGYMVGTELYVWTNGKWNDIVNMKGVQGDRGIQGIQGIKGDTGTGIQSTTTDYELSSQGVEVPNTGWSTTIPVTTNALPYLWTRVTITFTDGSQHVIYFTSNKGDKGDKGDTGEKGDTGANLAVKGAVDKATSLPSTGNSEGDAYLVGTDLYVYTKGAWKDCGPIVAENTVLYNTDGSLNVNGTNYNYVQDLRNGKIQYNDGTKNVQVTPMDADKEASDILAARTYTDTSVSALSTSVDTKLSSKANTADLSTGLATKVTDNKNGTEQLNGVKVQPFNKLSDTIGGRNLLMGTSGTLQTVTNASGWYANFPQYVLVEPTVNSNTTYTARIWLSPVSHDMRITLSWKDSSGKMNYGNGSNISAGTSGYSTWTGTITAGSTINYIEPAFTVQQTTDSTVSYKEMKFEQGSVATDWTPAPEDKVNVADMRKPASDVAGIEEVSTLQTQVNNSAVGTNLLINSNFSDESLAYWVVDAGMTTSFDSSGNLVMDVKATSGNRIYYPGSQLLVPGMTYAISFYAYVDSSSTSSSINVEVGPYSNLTSIAVSGTTLARYTGTVWGGNFTGNALTIAIGAFGSGTVGDIVHITKIKLEKGRVATDWCPNPEDKVNVSDMRKPANDVAGIEEVNAKQDKIGYTPADDSKVVHTTDTSSWQKQALFKAGSFDITSTSVDKLNFYDLLTQKYTAAGVYYIRDDYNVLSGAEVIDSVVISEGAGWWYAYGVNSKGDFYHRKITTTTNPVTDTGWVLNADDSKVAHLSGANNFDTVPTVDNNPLLLASSLPSDLARTGQANTFSKKQIFSTNPTNGTQVYPIYATADTDSTAATLIASLQSSGFSGMVGVPES